MVRDAQKVEETGFLMESNRLKCEVVKEAGQVKNEFMAVEGEG